MADNPPWAIEPIPVVRAGLPGQISYGQFVPAQGSRWTRSPTDMPTYDIPAYPAVFGEPTAPAPAAPEAVQRDVSGVEPGNERPDMKSGVSPAAAARAAAGLQGTTVLTSQTAEQAQKFDAQRRAAQAAAASRPETTVAQDIDPLRQRYAVLQERIRQMNENAPKKPDAPENDPMKAVASIGAILGVFGGMLTRQPLISGLNALSQAGAARKQNDMETYDRKMKEYTMQMQFAHEAEKDLFDVTKAIMDDKHKTYAEKQKDIELQIRARGVNMHAEQFTQSMRHREAMLLRSVQATNNAVFHQANEMLLGPNIPPDRRKKAVAELSDYQEHLSPGQFADSTQVAAILVNNGIYKSQLGLQTLQANAAHNQQIAGARQLLDQARTDKAVRAEIVKNGVQVGDVHFSGSTIQKVLDYTKDRSSAPPDVIEFYDFIKPKIGLAGPISATNPYAQAASGIQAQAASINPALDALQARIDSGEITLEQARKEAIAQGLAQ